MQELESALAQQAPPQAQDDPTLHELPPLVIDGIPTPVEKMTQVCNSLSFKLIFLFSLKFLLKRKGRMWEKLFCLAI